MSEQAKMASVETETATETSSLAHPPQLSVDDPPPSPPPSPPPPAVDSSATNLQVLHVLAMHWLLSSTVTFSNNILVDHRLPNLTVVLSAVQTITTTLLLAPFIWWGKQREPLLQLPVLDLLTRDRAFLSLCGSFIGMLTFNRMTLRLVGVACLPISRSLTVVFTLAFTYWLLNTPVRRSSLACCGVVIAGFVLGVNQSLESVTINGFVFGTISSLFTSVTRTMSKKAMPSFGNSPMLQTCVMNGVCSVLFLPLLLLSGELAILQQHWRELLTLRMLLPLLLSSLGTAAFGVVTSRVIHVTSPLTLVVSNSAHTTAQTLLAVSYFHQVTTPLWWLSVMLILLGTAGYALVRANWTCTSSTAPACNSTAPCTESAAKASEAAKCRGSGDVGLTVILDLEPPNVSAVLSLPVPCSSDMMRVR